MTAKIGKCYEPETQLIKTALKKKKEGILKYDNLELIIKSAFEWEERA